MTQQNSPNTSNGLWRWFLQVTYAFRHEWTVIFSDIGVMLFFIVLPLAYPIAYTLIYNPEIVTDLPVAVVDNSRTASSRRLVRELDAAPSFKVYDYCTDMAEAKDLFGSNEVAGILLIPSDYEKRMLTGRTAHATFFAETSLLLRYRALLSTLTDVQLLETTRHASEMMGRTGLSLAGMEGLPVNSRNHFLGDQGQGFASFIMPGIIILILQQSMMLGICFIGGTSRERRRRFRGYDPEMLDELHPTANVIGKSLCYTIFYIPVTLYVAHWVPEMFSLPHQGSPVDYLLFLFPMLLATAMLGQTVQLICTERESAFLVVVFSSVLFLFLSGLTWPRYAMSDTWRWVGNLVPATWGVEGFIRINSNGATLAESSLPFIAMWIQTGVYFLTAWGVTAWLRHEGHRLARATAPIKP